MTLGPAAVPRLVDALKFEKLRGQVAYILGQMGPAAAPAAPALAKLIADKDERVALEVAVALANIGPGAKGTVPALIEALGRPRIQILTLWPTHWEGLARTPSAPNWC